MGDPKPKQIVEIDDKKIFDEEINKIQKSSLFTGITLTKDENLFLFDKMEDIKTSKLAKKNPLLAQALQMEIQGYRKPGMTKDEIIQEKKTFEKHQYSLDFMLDDCELQGDEEIQEIIYKELEKLTKEKTETDEKVEKQDIQCKLRLKCQT